MNRGMETVAAARAKTGLWPVIRRETGIIARSPFYPLFIFVLPLASFGVVGAVFYNETPRDMPVVLHDRDNSRLSRQFTRMVDASPFLAVRAAVRDAAEGARYIREGKAYAIVYLPANLEHDVKRGDAPAVTVYFNNQWYLTSSLLSRAIREVAGTLAAGLDVRARMLKGESPPEAFEHYDPIRLDAHALFNPGLNYRHFLLPAILPALVQIFVIMVTVRAVAGELKNGTAQEWMATSGHKPWVALAGKLLPYTLCFAVLTLAMLALLLRVANVPLHGSAAVLLGASLLFVLAYQSMGFAIAVVCANLRLANSIAGFYSGPAFAFVGVTYPVLGMPLAARMLSACLPLTYYLDTMLRQAIRGAPPAASSPALAALALFAVLPPLLLLPRLKRVLQDPAYWGRV